MSGKPYVMRAVLGFRPRSQTLGADVSGTVVEVGSAVSRFAKGDEVFGEIGAGAYAQFARARQEHLAHKPRSVGFEDAGVVGVAGLTALQGLRDVIGVRPGQKILINGASGGVGTYAVQLAKLLGAEVTAVCSGRNIDQARALGADAVVDYERVDITGTGRRFAGIFDIAGNHSIGDCKGMLEPRGVYSLVGGPKGDWTASLPRMLRAKAFFAFSGKKTPSFVATSRSEDLAELGRLLASGQIRSVIADRYPLSDIAVPLDRQGEFHARAKTLVDVAGGI